MKTFIRFSVMRERGAISEHIDDNFGLVIDAHVLETFQNATSGFIIKNKLNYIVDPNTYRFYLDTIDECKSKRWFERLVDLYGIEDLLIEGNKIHYYELVPPRLDKFVKNVVKYQERRVLDLSGEMRSLISLFSDEPSPELKKPYCIIPPYFIIESEEELAININSIELAKKYTEMPIYALMPIYYDLIYDNDILDLITENYVESNADGYFIWITDFNEIREKGIVLRFANDFYISFKEEIGEKELINMFGGYYSTILSTQRILDGLVHGVGISESRDPYRESGPAPTRYYVQPLHRMLSLESASDILYNQPYRCRCPICEATQISDMGVSELIKHVLNAKMAERNEIIGLSLEEIIQKLNNDLAQMISVNRPDLQRRLRNYGVHINEWIKALKIT